MTSADLLNKAYEVLQTKGWGQGYFRVPGSSAHCLMGAVATAYYVSPDASIADYLDSLARLRVAVGQGTLADWNDSPDRSADEVFDALRRASELERSEYEVLPL